MTAKDYLSQARKLDSRIDTDLRQLEELRQLTAAVAAPALTERVQSSRCTEAPFERCYMRIAELEQKVNDEIDSLVALKEEMYDVIGRLEDLDEQTVLICRYLRNMSWPEVAEKLNAGIATAFRRHRAALEHIEVPEKVDSKRV